MGNRTTGTHDTRHATSRTWRLKWYPWLNSALVKPQQLYHYKPESTLHELATMYSFGLVKNHPFIDGNKRIAFTVTAVFLELNNKVLNAPEEEVVVLYEGLASGKINEEVLAQWLASNTTELGSE